MYFGIQIKPSGISTSSSRRMQGYQFDTPPPSPGSTKSTVPWNSSATGTRLQSGNDLTHKYFKNLWRGDSSKVGGVVVIIFSNGLFFTGGRFTLTTNKTLFFRQIHITHKGIGLSAVCFTCFGSDHFVNALLGVSRIITGNLIDKMGTYHPRNCTESAWRTHLSLGILPMIIFQRDIP